MNIVILGPQGSGKGTQADLICQKLGLAHIESGAILRTKAKTDERIKQMIDSGTIVPDDETVGYIDEEIKRSGVGYENLIFDGYPRNLNQYRVLKNWLSSKSTKIDYVIYLEISDEEAVKRLSSRRTCRVCGNVYNLVTNPPQGDKCSCGGQLEQREDDKLEIIGRRLAIFHKDTKPILAAAEDDGILRKIDGERPIETIHNDIIKLLK